MGITHFALNFGLGDHGGYRVDNNNVDCSRAHKRFTDFQRLLAGIGLRDKQ
ncbi:hypothetical protein SDC9_205859 [bioreactor metagenome]|uniref:Uncharacterized protein n=1 Tax=bioreactor metagenome TaxID=1076179 RepID=A0A645J3C2_9ZZZZ